MAATHVSRVLPTVRATASRRLPIVSRSTLTLRSRLTSTPTPTPTPAASRTFYAHARTTAFPAAPTRPNAAPASPADTSAAGADADTTKNGAADAAAPLPSLPDASSITTANAASSSPGGGPVIDWSASFHGLSTSPFPADVAAKLMTPIDQDDVEVKPDGILYLPEIKYRRILNGAFGPGGWGLAPRSELSVGEKVVTREYALVVHGRYVGQARGECPFFGEDGVATALEGCKSNALMRCCKDIGIASELWDPRFIRQFKRDYCREVWVEHVVTKKRRQIWLRKDCPPAYPYVLPTSTAARTVR